KLRERGIATVGQVAAMEEQALVRLLGVASGRHLHALAHNRDPRRVERGRRRRSVGAQRAFGRVPMSPQALDAILVGLVDRVTGRMRRSGRTGRTVVLRLRFDDYERAPRSLTLRRPTAATAVVLAAARELVAAAQPMIERRGITLIGLSVASLDGERLDQLALNLERDPAAHPDPAVDAARERLRPAALPPALR